MTDVSQCNKIRLKKNTNVILCDFTISGALH